MVVTLDIKNTYAVASQKTVSVMAEYIWLDGQDIPEIRSKTKILHIEKGTPLEKIIVPEWGFDGSSTMQAETKDSDCILKPVFTIYDPIRNIGNESVPHIIVLNEVYGANGKPHATNTRAKLREIANLYAADDFWFGIEQEYTLFEGKNPYGWPKDGSDYHEPQGRNYCGVGAGKQFGRPIIEEHMRACLKANLLFEGINAEVMPAQWEYQIGAGGPLAVGDHLTMARYLLERIAEPHGVSVSLAAKPRDGDWNGAGAHTNFSTKQMREGKDFDAYVNSMIAHLKDAHKDHIDVYGKGIEKRLTGKHETCNMNEFRSGVGQRNASIRIPLHVAQKKKGYVEDRRPCANIDPYVVMARIMETAGTKEIIVP